VTLSTPANQGDVTRDKHLDAIDRIVPRYQFEVRFKIEMKRADGTVTTEGWSRDLSESGLGAFVAAELLVGEQVTLLIPVRSEVELVIPAKVTRGLGTQYGFQFTALSTTQRTEILRVLTHNKALPYIPTTD
jgi:hypothetical protein